MADNLRQFSETLSARLSLQAAHEGLHHLGSIASIVSIVGTSVASELPRG